MIIYFRSNPMKEGYVFEPYSQRSSALEVFREPRKRCTSASRPYQKACGILNLQVGCQLLDRPPKGVEPTREDRALAHADVSFSAERAAEDELLSLRNLVAGRFGSARALIFNRYV
jgi:hypothetical protein